MMSDLPRDEDQTQPPGPVVPEDDAGLPSRSSWGDAPLPPFLASGQGVGADDAADAPLDALSEGDGAPTGEPPGAPPADALDRFDFEPDGEDVSERDSHDNLPWLVRQTDISDDPGASSPGPEGADEPAGDADRLLHDVAGRLDAIAARLRSGSVAGLLARRPSDPLEILLTGYVLGAISRSGD